MTDRLFRTPLRTGQTETISRICLAACVTVAAALLTGCMTPPPSTAPRMMDISQVPALPIPPTAFGEPETPAPVSAIPPAEASRLGAVEQQTAGMPRGKVAGGQAEKLTLRQPTAPLPKPDMPSAPALTPPQLPPLTLSTLVDDAPAAHSK